MRISTRMAGYYQSLLAFQAGDDSATTTQAQLLINKIKRAQTAKDAEKSADLPDSKDARLRAVAAKYDPHSMKASDLGRVAKELYDSGAISREDAYTLMFKANRGAFFEEFDKNGKLDWLKETEAEAKALKDRGSKNAAASQRALTLLKLLDSARTTKPVDVKV